MKKFYVTVNSKRLISFSLVAVLSFIFVFSLDLFYIKTFAETEKKSMPVIIIDPGHGGEDGGTNSSSGILEKDINLAISLKLNNLFKIGGFDTIMTREDDSLIYDKTCSKMREKKVSDIHNRMKILENNPNSIFISIHQNHFEQSKYYGTQVFYSKNNPESKIIAETIQDNIIKTLQSENTRRVKPSGTEIFLLYHAKTPTVMVECGFLSNPGEAEKLNDDDYQTQISAVIYNSILEYLQNRK